VSWARFVNRAGLAAAVLVLVVAIPFFVLSTALAALLNLLLMVIGIWYFPGDGPYAESVIELLPYPALALLAIVVTIYARGWFRRRDVTIACAVAVATLLAVAALPMAALANRHVGEWAELRRVALREVEKARADGVEWRELDDVTFRFAGLDAPVHLRTVSQHEGRRTVKVDFGGGANAWFDLDTMICVFSD
jgi:hypothetical protein